MRMDDAFEIVVVQVTRVQTDIGPAARVEFRISRDELVLSVPIDVGAAYLDEAEWIAEARSMLHGHLTILAQQTKRWAHPNGGNGA